MNNFIDLRSDVKTQPTDGMREAMRIAEVGDNVAGDDPTINKLESLGAETFEKEACLYCPSGTMSNLLAIVCTASPGEEVVIEEHSHICVSEVGGMAHVGGIMAHPVHGSDGIISPETLLYAIRPKGLAFSKTKVFCLENTHNFYGGRFLIPDDMEPVFNVAKEHGLHVHVDGERIFNAAVAQNIQVKEIVKFTDSITVGLSKGLCSPTGSLLVGPKSLIIKAKKTMKMLGGVMRKPGVLAAAGIISITQMWKRLGIDHENARTLADGLEGLPGTNVVPSRVVTNIVNVDISQLKISPSEFVSRAKEKGVLLGYHLFKPTIVRLVTYKDISTDDVIKATQIIKEIVLSLN